MKKGFTLIELLAVIVILAIIALIATPIVLNIIADTKENSRLRSAEFYLDAVELSVANRSLNNRPIVSGKYNILENGNVCLEYAENECIDELVIEVNGETPKGGTIVIENGKIVPSLSEDEDSKTILELDQDMIGFNDKNQVYIIESVLIQSVTVSYDHCYVEDGTISYGNWRKYLSGDCTPEITIEPANATNKELEFSISETTKYCGTTVNIADYLDFNNTTGGFSTIKTLSQVEGEAPFTITAKTTDGSNLSIDTKVYLYSGCMTCPR